MILPGNNKNILDPWDEEEWDNDSEFYAVFDNINELTDYEIELILDGVRSSWFNQEIDAQSRLRENYENLIPFLFRIIIPKTIYSTILSTFIEPDSKGITWFKIKINNTEGLPLQQYVENSENPTISNRFLEWIKIINPRDPVARRLNRFFSWDDFPLATEEQLTTALRLNPAVNGVHLNVYNVGQGSLNAVCDDNEVPLLYFDLGGGFNFNRFTYNQTLLLDWEYVNTIVVSHWDWDHLETARRHRYGNWEPYNGKNWIVPQQPLSPSYARFAAHISATCNLLIWPNNLRRIIIDNIEIIKCNGPHKNDSGLAIIVKSNEKIAQTLHPGDAAYRYIRFLKGTNLNGLVATHHGGQFVDNNAPLPTVVNGCIAYSYAVTRYGHPHANAVTAYVNNGWGAIANNRQDTVNGHISMRKPNPNRVFHHCGDPLCILCNLSYF
jgi:hypothetical protein